MKRLNLSLVVIVLLCMVGWTEHARGQRSNSAQQGWQYMVIDCDVQQLNRLGAGGWELVGTTTNQGCGLWLKHAK